VRIILAILTWRAVGIEYLRWQVTFSPWFLTTFANQQAAIKSDPQHTRQQ
jgi:hypothetical protein